MHKKHNLKWKSLHASKPSCRLLFKTWACEYTPHLPINLIPTVQATACTNAASMELETNWDCTISHIALLFGTKGWIYKGWVRIVTNVFKYKAIFRGTIHSNTPKQVLLVVIPTCLLTLQIILTTPEYLLPITVVTTLPLAVCHKCLVAFEWLSR